MTNNILTHHTALAAALLLALTAITACSEYEGEAPAEAMLAIDATIGGTRSVEDRNTFEKDDLIYLYASSADGSDLTVFDHTPAVYNGTSWVIGKGGIPLHDGQKLAIAALHNAHAGEAFSITPYYSEWPQKEILYAVSDSVSPQQPTASLTFHYALPRITLRISRAHADTDEAMTLTSVELYNQPSEQYPVYSNGFIDTKGRITDAHETYRRLHIYTNEELTKDNTTLLDMLVMPYDSVPLKAVLNLNINGNYYQGSLNNVQWLQGMHYVYDVNLSDGFNLAISQANILPRDDERLSSFAIEGEFGAQSSALTAGGTIGSPIDLGLSVKWADHNIGASSPSEKGHSFFWADVLGSTVRNPEQPIPALGTNICGTEFDMARAQWGDNWRLPTRAEAEELINNCTIADQTIAGVAGCRVTSKINGQSLFFPYNIGQYGYSGLISTTLFTGQSSRSTSNEYYTNMLSLSPKTNTNRIVSTDVNTTVGHLVRPVYVGQ